VVQSEGGGFTIPPPSGSECLIGIKRFTLLVAARVLAWTRSIGDGTTPYRQMSGSKILTEKEFRELWPLLTNLKVIKADGLCITDLPTLSVTVRTPTGEQKYVDDCSQCVAKGRLLIERDAIESVLDRLDELAVA
jgi:hypothetical protein